MSEFIPPQGPVQIVDLGNGDWCTVGPAVNITDLGVLERQELCMEVERDAGGLLWGFQYVAYCDRPIYDMTVKWKVIFEDP